jgi:hypothetical protein
VEQLFITGVDFLVQGHYILGQSYGLGTSENLHNNLNQFGQASSLPTMQQQAFPGNNQLTQVSYILSTLSRSFMPFFSAFDILVH